MTILSILFIVVIRTHRLPPKRIIIIAFFIAFVVYNEIV